MAANQTTQQQPQGQPQQATQCQQPYSYPPQGYYPQPQYCQTPKDEGIGVWTALGLIGAGFLLGQFFSEPAQPQQIPPTQQGIKMPWQK